MLEKKLSAAGGHNITVTSTATSLFSLIDTAASAAQNLPDSLDMVEILAEDGDIRYLMDGNTPSSTAGNLVVAGEKHIVEGQPVRKMLLIRVGSVDVAVSVRVGWRE